MKKIMILAALAAFTFTSCVGVLNQEPLSSDVVGADSYSNPTYRLGQLARIYGSFNITGNNGAGSSDIAVSDAGASEFIRAWWSCNTLTTDEAKCIWGDSWVKEIVSNTWTDTKNDAIYAVYVRGIMMVTLANNFLRNTDDSDPEIAIERAEVRTLRAMAYWILLDTFGNVPFTTEADEMGAIKPKQISAANLYAWLKTELEELVSAESHLKDVKTQVYPRIDKGAAYGLLARLLINHKSYTGTEDVNTYTEAMAAAKQVIDNKYALASEYRELFMGDNGQNPECLKEIVWAACYDANKTQSYGGPTYLIAASTNNNLNLGLAAGWAGLNTSSQFVSYLIGSAGVDAAKVGDNVDAFTSIDKRALVSLKYSEKKDQALDSFTAGWHVHKYNNFHSTDQDIYGERPEKGDDAITEQFASIDFPLIRAAEMYLIYAEAKTRVDGGTTTDAEALKAYNAIQKRAGLAGLATSISLEDVFTEITRELYWEGLRRTTLIRYNKYVEGNFVWPFKGGASSGQALSNHLKLFPIPDEDLVANDNLVQNLG
ncbi:MAG: RagB/SusD family nutrient uptake outer membrane protein, partial [Alistipes sp.]|nr:RagB/SusD family nutrient uptake outer membrane protein [Alistipes sp.]